MLFYQLLQCSFQYRFNLGWTIVMSEKRTSKHYTASDIPEYGYIGILLRVSDTVNPYSGNFVSVSHYHCLNPKTGNRQWEARSMEYSELYVNRIRQLCEKKGISINKLASMSGVRQSTLDNIVRGLTKNPRAMTLHKIALAFSMTLSEFLDFKELNEYAFDGNEDE